jgi:hypothetical protein
MYDFGLVIQIRTLFIFQVLSDKYAKRILINIVLIENGKIVLKIENSFELVIQFQTLFIFIVLSNSKICKKNFNQYCFN